MEFSQADYLTGIGKKSFVAELMPKHPLYTSFLSPEAQAVIGQTHPHTLPARHLLEGEGFRYEGYVDIFDAGPTVECDLDDVGAIAHSRTFTSVVSDLAPAADTAIYLVANTGLAGFRAALVAATPRAHEFPLSVAAAAALNVNAGEQVRAVALSAADRR
jgi:arginine N-succinyltransferase